MASNSIALFRRAEVSMNSEKLQKIGWVSLKEIFTLPVILLLAWIPSVIIIFATISDRKIAGVIAGIGFLTIPLINIYYERFADAPNSIRLFRVFFSALFWLVSAMPIFLLRIFNWEKSLEETSLFGLLSGRELHSLSNGLYIIMLVAYLLSNILNNIIKSRRKK